jgi:hypothetical protein
MPKALKDILNGVKSSKVVPGSTGSDPGVDYAPKAPNEQQFVKKHKIEKHEDRVGNGDDVYQASNVKHSQVGEPNHGYKKPEDKNINEARAPEVKKMHPAIHQLTKITYRFPGEEPQFKHKDGSKSDVGTSEAAWFLMVHKHLKNKKEKENFADQLHASSKSMKSAIGDVFARRYKPKKTNEEIELDEAARGEIFKKQASASKKEGDMRSFHYNMYKYHAHKSDVASSNYGLRSKQAKTHDNKATDHREKYKSFQEDVEQINMTEAGTSCPVHEMTDCSKPKNLREIAKNPYAIGMAAAMKQTGDKPPLKKSTITKAHDIAKSVKEDYEGFNSGAEHGAGSTEQMQEALSFPIFGESDDESAEMAKTQLRALANKALHLAMQLNDDQVVEPWVQSKIAVAKDYVTAVHDYMLYGDHESKSKENEQTAPYDGGIDMTGAPRNTYPSFSADVNTGRVV